MRGQLLFRRMKYRNILYGKMFFLHFIFFVNFSMLLIRFVSFSLKKKINNIVHVAKWAFPISMLVNQNKELCRTVVSHYKSNQCPSQPVMACWQDIKFVDGALLFIRHKTLLHNPSYRAVTTKFGLSTSW